MELTGMWSWLNTRDDAWILWVRPVVGAVVFFPEGIQKLIFPAIMGAGRFARIGIPWPHFTGPFIGTFEIFCGALITMLSRSICLLIEGGGRCSANTRLCRCPRLSIQSDVPH